MLLVVPLDSPDWLLRACARTPYPTALLRPFGRVNPGLLLRFPLILDPNDPPPPGDKNDLALVSQSYSWIEWAKEKGWRAVWVNPEKEACPKVHPLHDLEIEDPQELSQPLRFPYPDLAEALGLLEAHGAPQNLIQHSLAVAGVAHSLGKKMREKGFPLDLLLVHRGGLLHDLDKIKTGQENKEHGEIAFRILTELGYPTLGEIARRHVLKPGSAPRTWEEKLVFYADKIVEGDEVVGLETRISALRARYPQFHREINEGEAFLRELQKEILSVLGCEENELLGWLQSLPLGLSPPFR